MLRNLKPEERTLIRRIAERLNPENRSRLEADLEQAMARPATDDGSRVMFEIAGYQRPAYEGQHSYGVGGTMRDSDGAELSIDLFADENGRLLELEFIRWGDGDLMDPDWSTLELQ